MLKAPRRPKRPFFLAHELRSPLASVVLRLGSLMVTTEQQESVLATLTPQLAALSASSIA